MGVGMSRLLASGGGASNVELTGTYQRFDEPEAAAAWVASGRESWADYTAQLTQLTGLNVGDRRFRVQPHSQSQTDLVNALDGLPKNQADFARAWTEVMVQGIRREGSEHFATLLRLGALDLNHPRDAESSLLHKLARDGKDAEQYSLVDRVRLLNSAGVNLDLSSGGVTPAHAAILADNAQTLAALLAVGVDLNARDAEGRTPLALALELAAQGSDPADLEQGVLRPNIRNLVNALQVDGPSAGTTVEPTVEPRSDADKLWGSTAWFLKTVGLVAASAGAGVAVMGTVVGNRLRQGIDDLSKAQSQNADSIAAFDQALVGGMNNLTAAQVGPIDPLTVEEAEKEFLRCVEKESLLDGLPRLPERPHLPEWPPLPDWPERSPEPRLPELPPLPDWPELSPLPDRSELPPLPDPLEPPPLPDQPSRDPMPKPMSTTARPAADGAIDGPGGLGDVVDGIAGSVEPRPTPRWPNVGQGEPPPCRDELDRYRLALYQDGNYNQQRLARQHAQYIYHGTVRDGAALAGGLVAGGSGLLIIGTLISYWMKRRAQAPAANA